MNPDGHHRPSLEETGQAGATLPHHGFLPGGDRPQHREDATARFSGDPGGGARHPRGGRSAGDVRGRDVPCQRPPGEGGPVGNSRKDAHLAAAHSKCSKPSVRRRRQSRGDQRPKTPCCSRWPCPRRRPTCSASSQGRGEVWLVPTPERTRERPMAPAMEVANAETLAELLGMKPPPRPAPPFETAIYRRGHS